MYEIPQKAHRARSGSRSPLNFFAISNLETIEECERDSRGMQRDRASQIGSLNSEGITALPVWEGEVIQEPRPVLTRHGSRDRILEKSCFYAEESELSGNALEASNPGNRRRRQRPSRFLIWLVLAVVILLGISIVLGAILGTFARPKSTNSRPSVTEVPGGLTTPTPTPTGSGDSRSDPPKPTSSSHIHSLAVTGWHVPEPSGYYTSWLFSQDADGWLSRHSYNSSTGNWTRVSNFAAARHGTPLAATAVDTAYYAGQENYAFSKAGYQVSVMYLDKNDYLNEWTFSEDGKAMGQSGSLTDQKYIAHENTTLTSYWPSIIYQGLSGEIREAQYECHKKDDCWHNKVLKTTTEAANGTQLIMVPLRNNLSLVATALFYHGESGKYVSYLENNGESRAASVWQNEALSNLIPPNASISAFSTTRPNSKNALTTYLLWQNGTGIAQMSWSDTEAGWRGPVTHAAFAGADNNTALACLTGLTFINALMVEGSELSRCYFRAGLAVREVSFNGASWDVVGNVPTFGF